MKRTLGWLLWLTISLSLPAQEQHHQSYVGSHGMVMFAANDTLLVSHLPLYRPPHDYQIVYQIIVAPEVQQAVLNALEAETMLTVLPQNFDLSKMINALQFSMHGDIYKGHFEREGKIWLKDVMLQFERQVFLRPLTPAEPATSVQHYSAFSVDNQHFFLHHISAAPSYDQIIHISGAAVPKTLTAVDAAAALKLLQQQKLSIRQLYLETQDFNP